MVAGVTSAVSTVGSVTTAATGALVTVVGGVTTAAVTSVLGMVIGGTAATAVSTLATTIAGATTAVTSILTTVVSGTTAAAKGALTVAGSILPGPIGWAVLGVTEQETSTLYTFDCWKPVLHDESSEPSNGKILREVVADPRIQEVTITLNNSNKNLPYLILKNVWNEEFRIDYVYLPCIGLAAHAVRI